MIRHCQRALIASLILLFPNRQKTSSSISYASLFCQVLGMYDVNIGNDAYMYVDNVTNEYDRHCDIV